NPATSDIFTLSLHDALPICTKRGAVRINHREGPFPFLSQIATAFAADAGDKLAGSGAGCSLRASDFAVGFRAAVAVKLPGVADLDRKSTRLNSSHVSISYAV